MKLWGGRFEKATDHMVDDFHSSISFDKRLYAEDISGSIAHATMLGETGILTGEEAREIVEGLKGIRKDIAQGKVQFDTEAEDIHMNIEKLLIERIGENGKRLHTGRSRNDQVALDGHMFVMNAVSQTRDLLQDLMRTVLSTARQHLDTVMPGYTHLQKAQPVTLAHHMMAWFQMLKRDDQRLREVRDHADSMPLGSGALAGTTYPLNRQRVAELLGFSRITENSMDGVSDRDFMLDYIYAASVSMMHLSRFCEELVLWSSHEFRFVEMDDGFATGSSIMPQKKNPDVAELIRGKTGRVYGDLIGLLTTMKGIPLAYDKDMQEDKEALFDAHDTWTKCLLVFDGMLKTLSFRKEVMEKGAAGGFTNATDAADYLVRKGMPFRQAHEVVGRMVLDAIRQDKSLNEFSLAQMREYSELFDADVFDALSILACVSDRRVPGGPAPQAVLASIESGQKYLDECNS
ncbi:MAG: argininosuccinate lyase [Clostridia bacterium]|nr:argininosuccinate lyase [Clostridia bacterium]